MLLRKAGFLATIAAGMTLLGAAFHGITSVDHDLKLAAATPAPSIDTVNERSVHNCDRPHHRTGQEV
jgi:hypothetical protein